MTDVAEAQTPKEPIAAPPGYKIIKKMGQGGMATVYLAIQESFGRQVALKIMSDELGQDSVWARRFIHEAQVVAQLSHPNIVPVFDVGTFNGRFYISMELLKGGNLDDKIAKGLSIPEIVRIIVGVAAGLDFAGEKGFVHRDIKPDNVMFREDGSPVILDFGIVKQKGGGSGDKMTQTGTIVGTTAYMSPEQAMGQELDEGSDIYSLGIMFYELLAGRVPFQGESAVAVLLKHVNEPPPPLPDFVSVFQPVIDKALAKKRSDRYPRARAMIEHIQQLEPQIRELIARQQAAFSQSGSDDATGVQSAIGNNAATQVMSKAATKSTKAATAVHNKQTAETELTDVLSSAKATISNFSEEARLRRARNTKRAIVAAVVIVVLALSYVAYQQFYVVPHAAQLASAQRGEKIAALLTAAEDAKGKLVLTDLKAVDALIAQYREVLVLDPENADVRSAMDELGQKYVDLAGTELANNNLSLADSYRDYASQLAPKNEKLASLGEQLTKARSASTQQEAQKQFNQQQIATLLGDAEKNIKAGQLFTPAEDNAYGKFQQILKMDPTNADAQKRINTLTDNLYTETQNAVSSQQWRTVTSNLELLDRVYPDKAKVATLKSSYSVAKQKADEQARLAGAAQRKQDLLNKIAQLKKETRTRNSNGDLRDAAQNLLSMETGNSTATAALDDANRFDMDQADKAIKQRDYARATQHLGDLEKAAPSYVGLADMKSKLNQAKSAAQKADQLLATAGELTNSTKTDDAKRQDLAKAYAAIDTAKQVDPANPGINSALSSLETEYLLNIRELMANQQRALVEAYFADTVSKNWPTDRIIKAQMTYKSTPETAVVIPADKPKPKRVMSGGF